MLPEVLDAVGLAVFVGIGVNKAPSSLKQGREWLSVWAITGVGGGIDIRDVLARGIL